MLSLVLALALTAAPAAGEPTPPVKLASPGFNAVNISEQLATFYSDHFAQQLALRGVRVVTASEISALLGLERQKALLGCSDDSNSCVAELANALGVDAMIIGSVAKFDNTYQVNLKIAGAADATPWAIHSGQAEGDKGLLAELNKAAAQMVSQVHQRLGRSTPVQISESGRGFPVVPTIVGGVLAVAGTGLWINSFEEVTRLQYEGSLEQLRQRQRAATFQRVGGIAGIGAGLATIGIATYLYAASGDHATVTPSVTVGPQGVMLGLAGVIP